jgi:HAD superfamily hydrolase (TIGR01458 family)
MLIGKKEILGLLVDLDGVLYVDETPIPGAIETVNRWNQAAQPRCYLTNTTTQSLATLGRRLRQMGFGIEAGEVLSSPEAARLYLERLGRPVCKLVLADDVLADFGGFEQSETDAKVVVLGDVGNAWSYDLLNTVFRLLMSGAELVALQRNKFWQTAAGLHLDIGAFVAGLEYATGKSAKVIGKPSPEFFTAALSRLGMKAAAVAMIGDDIDHDILPAQQLGMTGILVKTGKYRESHARASGIEPDLVIDSIAELATALP